MAAERASLTLPSLHLPTQPSSPPRPVLAHGVFRLGVTVVEDSERAVDIDGGGGQFGVAGAGFGGEAQVGGDEDVFLLAGRFDGEGDLAAAGGEGAEGHEALEGRLLVCPALCGVLAAGDGEHQVWRRASVLLAVGGLVGVDLDDGVGLGGLLGLVGGGDFEDVHARPHVHPVDDVVAGEVLALDALAVHVLAGDGGLGVVDDAEDADFELLVGGLGGEEDFLDGERGREVAEDGDGVLRLVAQLVAGDCDERVGALEGQEDIGGGEGSAAQFGLHAVDSDMVEGASTAVPPTAMRSVWAVAPLVGDVISISGGWVSRRTVAVSWSVRPTASVACAIVSLSPSEFKGTPSATK